MRFSLITTLSLPLLSSALVARLYTHQVAVTDLTVRNIESSIESVEFKIDDTLCSASKPTTIIQCGDSAYRFFIAQNAINDYNLTIYEETGPAVGLWQPQELTVICRAGGTGPTDYVCNGFQQYNFTLSYNGQL